MHIETKIQKWGNSLALRVSGVMRDIPGFHEGAVVDVEVTEEGLIIRKRQPKPAGNLPLTEAELLTGLDERNAHADLLADPLPAEIPE